ncbi:MAG TPA: immune inhibitor A domain-containing protein, partial [Candidatus Deferrimicrobium sp.]|nr:immune inhibitor A domain-containing protein [Candidatus Deferrimicrobium sp.]
MKLKKVSMLALSALMTVSLTVSTYAAPAMDGNVDNGTKFVQKQDNRPDQLTTKQLELKEQALNAKLNGKGQGKVHQVAKGQYVELAREGQGEIWTLLGEYSDLKHNSMPEPDRKVNNTTMWTKDFSRQHYLDLLFNDAPGANSMRNFYKEQS